MYKGIRTRLMTVFITETWLLTNGQPRIDKPPFTSGGESKHVLDKQQLRRLTAAREDPQAVEESYIRRLTTLRKTQKCNAH